MSTEYVQPEPWVAVDCDGVLAEYDGYSGPEHIGVVIPRMKERVLQWIKEGITVKIFTARASIEGQAKMIQDWLEENGMPRLEVTNVKDMGMVEFYDDRCTKVIFNTGLIFEEKNLEELQKEIAKERTRCAQDRAIRDAMDARIRQLSTTPPAVPPERPFLTLGNPYTSASMKRKAEKAEAERIKKTTFLDPEKVKLAEKILADLRERPFKPSEWSDVEPEKEPPF